MKTCNTCVWSVAEALIFFYLICICCGGGFMSEIWEGLDFDSAKEKERDGEKFDAAIA